MILNLFIIVLFFFFMEFMAWFTHKYIMHGFLWVLHKDHHIRDGRKLEKNDWFAFIFAIPSFILIFFGSKNGIDIRFYMGIGIALYGLAYFLFHDVLVHQRLKVFKKIKNKYLIATIKAHEDHHKPNVRSNYGFLIAPLKYYKEAFRKNS